MGGPAHLVVKKDALAFLDELPTGLVDCVFTDPPYDGLNQHLAYGKARSANTTSHVWYRPFTNDQYPEFLNKCANVMKENAMFFCMFDNFSFLDLAPLVRDFFGVKSIIVWDKTSIGPGYYFRRQHELILFATQGKRKLLSAGTPDILAVPRVRGKGKYPTEKPVELIRRCLAASVGPGDVVLDPFGGSGSTSEAAELVGAHSIYADVSDDAVERVTLRLRARGAFVTDDFDEWLGYRDAHDAALEYDRQNP